jgi:hypothetical protein
VCVAVAVDVVSATLRPCVWALGSGLWAPQHSQA